MTHPVLRISATLALLLTVAAWLLPWTVYPDGLAGSTQVWELGRRRTWLVVTLAVVGAVVLVSAVLALSRLGARRSATVLTVLVVVAAAVAVVAIATVDLGMVTWTGRGPDGTFRSGGDPIHRGVGLWLAAAAPVLAAVGAVTARVSDRTGRTPAPARPPSG